MLRWHWIVIVCLGTVSSLDGLEEIAPPQTAEDAGEESSTQPASTHA